jgi:1,2-diacylglycerol 3-beta-glucosyltransferase
VSESSLVILFFVLVLAYFAEYFIFMIGVGRAVRAVPPNPDAHANTKVTILVCARDEEANIDDCVRSLSSIDYPSELLEILIVDDKSTDRTPERLVAWQAKLSNLKVLRTGEEIANLRGKVNALAQGMDAATGEIVMITDADSSVAKGWVKEYLKYYDTNTGMVASVTLLHDRGFFDGLQSLDWAYLLGMASASANINVPLSVIGNNMTVRKTAYESVGGYREIPFSVTEDYALFQALWHKQPWTVKFPIAKNLTVMSTATPDFKTWWRQKHRWVKGGQGLKAIGYVIFAIGLLGNLAMATALFALPIAAALMVILIKWAGDLLIILPVLIRTRQVRLLIYFPIYEIYLFLFVFSMPIMMMQKNVKWKGRVYQH